jgi:hypothetical protein
MRAWMVGVFAVLSVGCQTVQAPEHDHIHRNTAGLMSIGLDIYIDLETGVIKARTSRVGLAGSRSHNSRRQLTPQQLATLRETVRRDLIEGPISKKCKDEDQAAKDRGEPPIDRSFNDDDGMTFLDVQFEGRSERVTDGICESLAFDELNDVAHDLAKIK